MIQDARIAKRTLRLLGKAKEHLAASLDLVRSNCSAKEYREYAGLMSQVLGRIVVFLENPIFCQHPSMAPEGLPLSAIKKWAEIRGNSEDAPAPSTRRIKKRKEKPKNVLQQRSEKKPRRAK